MPGGLERPAERLATRGDLRVRGVARRTDAGHVPLDVDREDRDAERGQLAGEDLERLGLARAGGAGDEAVPVDPGQGDLDADVGQDLVAEHGRAEGDRRLVEPVAIGHVGLEALVHVYLPQWSPIIGAGADPCLSSVLGGARVRAEDPHHLRLPPEVCQRGSAGWLRRIRVEVHPEQVFPARAPRRPGP